MMPLYRAKMKDNYYSVGRMDSKSIWLWMNVYGSLSLIETSWNDIELQEYSGIDDVNEKEIYEGDMVFAYGGEQAQGANEFEESGVIEKIGAAFYLVNKKNTFLLNEINCYMFLEVLNG